MYYQEPDWSKLHIFKTGGNKKIEAYFYNNKWIIESPFQMTLNISKEEFFSIFSMIEEDAEETIEIPKRVLDGIRTVFGFFSPKDYRDVRYC